MTIVNQSDDIIQTNSRKCCKVLTKMIPNTLATVETISAVRA